MENTVSKDEEDSTSSERPPPMKNKIMAWTKNTTASVVNRVKLALNIVKMLCILLTFLVSLINVIVMIVALVKNGLFNFNQGGWVQSPSLKTVLKKLGIFSESLEALTGINSNENDGFNLTN